MEPRNRYRLHIGSTSRDFHRNTKLSIALCGSLVAVHPFRRNFVEGIQARIPWQMIACSPRNGSQDHSL